jgi:hypothetical protein
MEYRMQGLKDKTDTYETVEETLGKKLQSYKRNMQEL